MSERIELSAKSRELATHLSSLDLEFANYILLGETQTSMASLERRITVLEEKLDELGRQLGVRSTVAIFTDPEPYEKP